MGLWLNYFQIKSNKTVAPKVRTTSTGGADITLPDIVRAVHRGDHSGALTALHPQRHPAIQPVRRVTRREPTQSQ